MLRIKVPIPTLIYRVGGVVCLNIVIYNKEDRVLIKYILDAHSDTLLRLKPFSF